VRHLGPRMRREPSRLQLCPRGSDGLLRVSFAGLMSDGVPPSRRVRLIRELLSWSMPAPLHVVISADERGSWSWAGAWQAALAAADSERMYVLHDLGDRRDGR
jgi:hypothetical protein